MAQNELHSFIFQCFTQDAFMGLLACNTDDLNILYTNKKLNEILETSDSPTQLAALYPKRPNDRYRIFDQEILSQEGYHQDVMVDKIGGGSFIANIGVRLESYAGKSITLVMIEDVTHQKKMQRELLTKQEEIKSAFEELLEQNKKLKELDLAKNRFIAVTTHELRTPMSAILAAAEVLTLGLYDSDEQRNEFLAIINEQALHLSSLINDVLDFAKIQAGKMDFYVQQEDIHKFLKEVLEAHFQVAKDSGIALKHESVNTPLLCHFDSVRLKQVVDNILSNAIKYNKKNGSVSVFTKESDDFVQIFVQDTGTGISQENLKKVFDEFETLGKVGNHQKGTGLGMPISKRLIEGMGGSIHLESEVGVGTTFWIQIPKGKVLDSFHYRTRDDSFDLAAS